jgi:hypothetical protein
VTDGSFLLARSKFDVTAAHSIVNVPGALSPINLIPQESYTYVHNKTVYKRLIPGRGNTATAVNMTSYKEQDGLDRFLDLILSEYSLGMRGTYPISSAEKLQYVKSYYKLGIENKRNRTTARVSSKQITAEEKHCHHPPKNNIQIAAYKPPPKCPIVYFTRRVFLWVAITYAISNTLSNTFFRKSALSFMYSMKQSGEGWGLYRPVLPRNKHTILVRIAFEARGRNRGWPLEIDRKEVNNIEFTPETNGEEYV